MDCIVIIPARFASSRFPGKLLATLAGRPLIEHVVERCLQLPGSDATIVATDDEKIAAAASAAGAETVLTTGDFSSGTDRVAHVARGFDAEVVVNVQADEVLVDPVAVGVALDSFRNSETELGTLRMALRSTAELWDPNVVKVVVDGCGRALYFSRAPIPYPRARAVQAPGGGLVPKDDLDDIVGGHYWTHLGVYLYRRAALDRWAALPPSRLERCEGLEQLRVLESGEVMQTYEVPEAPPGVNTPDDLERIRSIYEASLD
jgi:3-deoxy-manno-octulosonate cytidylyltransferase (CMP-KDO synthetase)